MTDDTPDTPLLQEPRLWQDEQWTAQVIKNEDDDGWAVAMFKSGASEPALVGPWTMGRDKKNPKPLDINAFNTLVKTASEVVRRHEQHLQATLHKKLTVTANNQQITVALDIVLDEDDPHALLSATDLDGNELAQIKVKPDFKLNSNSAHAWIDSEYAKPK
jgi:maltose-binding protein MalE